MSGSARKCMQGSLSDAWKITWLSQEGTYICSYPKEYYCYILGMAKAN